MNEPIHLVLNTMPSGAIVFNKNLDIVYSNNQAVYFLKHYEIPPEVTSVSTRIFHAINDNKLQEQFAGEIYITKKLDGSSSVWNFRMFICEEPKPLVAVFIIEESMSNNLNMNKVRQQFRLTRREIDILRRVVDGLPNIEIAEALEITEQTVKDHLSNVYMKTGFKNRVALLSSLLSSQVH
jgi:DNA-binding CsgD family transcriptional regulator